MIRDIPPYIKGAERYSRYHPYGRRFVVNEADILANIGNPEEPPPTFKQPVSNARILRKWDDGQAIGIRADQDHHFHRLETTEDTVFIKAASLKQFVDFRKYSSGNPAASLVLAIPTLDRILQTSLKQLLFYYYGLGIGYVNGTPESVLLFRRHGSLRCAMAFADFEASFIIGKKDPPITKGDWAVMNNRLPGHEWIARAVCYSLLSNCPVPEANPEAGQPDQPYDPIAVALFHEGQKWYEILRFTPYSRLREPLHYSEYQNFTARAANEDMFFPAEHTVERYFYRYLMKTSTWRTRTEPDLHAFSKMAATLVYLLHEDPAKRLFAIGIWCGNSPPASTWTLNRVDLQQWIYQPWEEPLKAPWTFYLQLYHIWGIVDDVDAFNSGNWNPSWLQHHYGVGTPSPVPTDTQRVEWMTCCNSQSTALSQYLDFEEDVCFIEDELLLADFL